MAAANHRVLIVDDHVELANLLAQLLKDVGLEVVVATSAEKGLTMARTLKPRVALVDLLLPDKPGHNLLSQLAAPGGPSLIVMTGVFKGRAELEQVKTLAPIVGWYEKPFDVKLLVRDVVQLLRQAPAPDEDLEIDILEPGSLATGGPNPAEELVAHDLEIEVDMDASIEAAPTPAALADEDAEMAIEEDSEDEDGGVEIELAPAAPRTTAAAAAPRGPAPRPATVAPGLPSQASAPAAPARAPSSQPMPSDGLGGAFSTLSSAPPSAHPASSDLFTSAPAAPSHRPAVPYAPAAGLVPMSTPQASAVPPVPPARAPSNRRVITLEELSSAMDDPALLNDPIAAELDRALMAAGLGSPLTGSTGDLVRNAEKPRPMPAPPREVTPEVAAIRAGFRSKMRTGQVRPATVPRLLTAFFMSQETGEIGFEHGGARKIIYFFRGRPAYATSNQDADRVATLSRKTFGLQKVQLDQILQLARSTSRMVSDVVAERRLLAEPDRAELLREETRVTVRSLLTWADGNYVIVFNGGHPLAREELGHHPAALVLQGVREMFDLARLRKLVPDRLRPLPAAKPPYELQEVPMGDAEALLLLRVTGGPSVGELVQEFASRLDEQGTRALIYGLMALGILSSGKVVEAPAIRAAP